MNNDERIFITIMRELCAEKGINLEKLSFGWILQLTKDDKVRHITGNNFDFNGSAATIIAGDKYATYEVLNSQGIPVVKHMMVFNPISMGSYVEDNGNYLNIASEFTKYGKLVVKPNRGFQGHGVTLCTTLKETEVAVQNLFKNHGSISISPYYDIETEFRTFYLNGEILLIYGKTKPTVIGDGKSTLKQLIDEQLDLHEDKKIVQDNLNMLDLTAVPSAGEKIDISWKHNLSGGAKSAILKRNSALYKRIESLAIKAGKAMNINFATIDIIKTAQDDMYVLEVNSGVCSTILIEQWKNGYKFMKDVYSKALDELFKD